MSGADRSVLLHNMSVPPKGLIRYYGLADPSDEPSPPDVGEIIARSRRAGTVGVPVRFELPADCAGRSPAAILQGLGVDAGHDPGRTLAALVDARAGELPLPDGCLVIPVEDWHRRPWPDALSALAVLAKCSDTLWLRARQPAINAALLRGRATLLVPQAFAHALPVGAA